MAHDAGLDDSGAVRMQCDGQVPGVSRFGELAVALTILSGGPASGGVEETVECRHVLVLGRVWRICTGQGRRVDDEGGRVLRDGMDHERLME